MFAKESPALAGMVASEAAPGWGVFQKLAQDLV